jgi:acetyltransferase-like isoleucine patch superfamily enzyme
VDKQKFVEFTPGEYFAKIGNDVWIGSDVLIMEGVEIRDGAIVGSGAVVSKNLEPYSVNVGNPIKEIRKRFEDKEIEKLLKLKWWDKDLDWIKSNASKFEDVKNVIK